jgi:HD-GYP domain-containing protein (c-di-GMP phosphodiesterase class II)
VIDTLDAMTSDRPYRRGMSFDAAKSEILRLSGTQLDPQAVSAFLALELVLHEMVDLKSIQPLLAKMAGATASGQR